MAGTMFAYLPDPWKKHILIYTHDCMMRWIQRIHSSKLKNIGSLKMLIRKSDIYKICSAHPTRDYIIIYNPCNFRARTLAGAKAPHLHGTFRFLGCRTGTSARRCMDGGPFHYSVFQIHPKKSPLPSFIT